MIAKACVALITCPDLPVARTLASRLVEGSHAACVNIVPGVESVYRWQGKIESDAEVLLIAKTRTDALEDIQNILNRHHPYELPELVSVSIESGSEAYLDWINMEVNPGV